MHWSFFQQALPPDTKGFLNKDPTFWLDGARTPHKYIYTYVKISEIGVKTSNLPRNYNNCVCVWKCNY
jgi:hypothetical protein